MNRRTFLKTGLACGTSLVVGNVFASHAEEPPLERLPNGNWSAPVLRVDRPNGNGRVYTRAGTEKAISEFYAQNVVSVEDVAKDWNKGYGARYQLTGRIQHSKDNYDFSALTVSHEVINLKLQDDYLVAEIEPNDTKFGKKLQFLLREYPDQMTFRPVAIVWDSANRAELGRLYQEFPRYPLIDRDDRIISEFGLTNVDAIIGQGVDL